jgi:hypothetical protein
VFESPVVTGEKFLNLSQEQQSILVFGKLSNMHYAPHGADGITEEGTKSTWHYYVGSRHVCQSTFLLANPISLAQLYILQRRLEEGKTMAHDKLEYDYKGDPECKLYDSPAQLGIVGWYQGYADVTGDYMPDEQHLIVPTRDRKDEWEEYKLSLGDNAGSYSYFCAVLRDHPMLSHVRTPPHVWIPCQCQTLCLLGCAVMRALPVTWPQIRTARPLVNFQGCSTCAERHRDVKVALQEGVRVKIEAAKAARRAHINQTRAERIQLVLRYSNTHTVS